MTAGGAPLEPRFVTGDAMRVAGLAERYTMADRHRIPEQWKRFHARLGEVEGRVDPAEFGLVYAADGAGPGFEYVTGVMVDEAAALPDGFVERRPPVRDFAVFTHRGPVSALASTLNAIFGEWLPGSGYRVGGDPQCTEVYGPDFDPKTLTGDIDVYIPVEKDEAGPRTA